MRILVHFEAAGHISDHLQQVASEIDKGRTFGLGWCLISDGKCPFPGSNLQGSPCRGDVSLCKRLHPVTRILATPS